MIQEQSYPKLIKVVEKSKEEPVMEMFAIVSELFSFCLLLGHKNLRYISLCNKIILRLHEIIAK
jgi:hypothetical protein